MDSPRVTHGGNKRKFTINMPSMRTHWDLASTPEAFQYRSFSSSLSNRLRMVKRRDQCCDGTIAFPCFNRKGTLSDSGDHPFYIKILCDNFGFEEAFDSRRSEYNTIKIGFTQFA